MVPKQSFPHLSKLLVNLRSGLKQFGLSEIEDLLRGRSDRDFNKKIRDKSHLLQDAIREIQKKDRKHSPDPGQIKFLLWKRISKAIRVNSKEAWDAENIGHFILSELQGAEDERLVCIPLYGSVAPWRKEPDKRHQLSLGVWIFEPARSIERLIVHLEDVFGGLPPDIEGELRKIHDSPASEFDALISEPLLACRTKGRFSRRTLGLSRYGLPLIALHNIVTVNSLDTSDDLALLYYMINLAPPAWPQDLRLEWERTNDNPIALENGLTEPHHIVSAADASRKVWSYEFHLKDGIISPFHWDSEPLANRPPLLILSSLLEASTTARLIEHGFKISQTPETDLDRRLAHVTLMWTKASEYIQNWNWEGGFDENDWGPALVDPDSLMLYSTIVLESLFSSESDKQEITSRIADLTAALLGRSGNDRYELSKKIKLAYGLRSDFVHGSVDRPAEYSEKAAWLYKIVTLALWEIVKLRTASDSPFSNWTEFIEYVQRRKFGAEKRNEE